MSDGLSLVSGTHTTHANGGSDATSGSSTASDRIAHELRSMRQRMPPSFPSRGLRDVTAKFISASKQLPPGELVKDEYFTLFEAVGALEIMDPKMDSGWIPPDDTFDPDFDAAGNLEGEEVLWIMDELLRLELLFHEGYPLSQTIFTSLHVFRLIDPENDYPYELEHHNYKNKSDGSNGSFTDTVLRAYCLGVIKCCESALNLIQGQMFYEEEDFVTYLFGRELCPKLHCDEALRLLSQAMSWLDGSAIDSDLQTSLKQRLNMRQDLLCCMDTDLHGEKGWQRLRRSIGTLETSHENGKAAPAAFSDKVQRQLATSTPPRSMTRITWSEGLQKWTRMCDDVLAAYALTSSPVRQTPHGLQRATWAFAYRKPDPNTFVRAKMQHILTWDERVADDTSHFELLLADIRELVLPGDPLADLESFQVEVTNDPRHLASRVIEDAMMKLFSEYLNIYRMVCQNRCRMRRTFTQAIPLWSDLVAIAEQSDQQLSEIVAPRRCGQQGKDIFYPLTSWVKFHQSRINVWTIQLGFETDLYLDYEHAAMYETLAHVSQQAHADLTCIEFAAEQRYQEFTARASPKEYLQQIVASRDWIRSLTSLSWINWTMASNLKLIFEFLTDCGLIGRPRGIEWYEARFKPFLSFSDILVPEPHTMHALREQSARLQRSAHELQKHIQADVVLVKERLATLASMQPEQVKCIGTEIAWKSEVAQLQRANITVGLSMAQLFKICQRSKFEAQTDMYSLKELVEVRIPPAAKRFHAWWAIPEIKEKK